MTYHNIDGYRVKILRKGNIVFRDEFWFCAYVTLPNSRFLNDETLHHPSYRFEDTVGVDTASIFDMDKTEWEMYGSALQEIEVIIHAYKKTLSKPLPGSD